MTAGNPYIVVRLQTRNPIEIGDFVSQFTSVASQYDKFIKKRYPDFAPEAEIYVKQVRRSSIIFELLPFMPDIMFGAEALTHVEHINAINEFVRTYKEKVSAYFKVHGKDETASRSDLTYHRLDLLERTPWSASPMTAASPSKASVPVGCRRRLKRARCGD